MAEIKMIVASVAGLTVGLLFHDLLERYEVPLSRVCFCFLLACGFGILLGRFGG